MSKDTGNVNYMFDESFLDEAIASEIQSGQVALDKEEGAADLDIDKEKNSTANAKSDKNKDINIDEAIAAELGEDIGVNYDEDGGKPEEGDPTKSSSRQDDADDGGDEGDNLYAIAFDIIKQEGLLAIPDDFNVEDLDDESFVTSLEQFKNQTLQNRDQQIIDYRRNKFADDEYKLRVFDYFFSSDGNADLPTFIEANNSVKAWNEYDISSEDNQKEIIRNYLQEGLNPNSPNYELLSKDIDSKVDDIISNLEGDKYAEQAKQYFIEKNEKVLEQEEARVQEIKNRIAQQEAQEQEAIDNWNSQFQQQIMSQNWDNAKKRQILQEQYSEVQFGDQNVPVWYAKEMVIKNNPELHLVYLDWLNNNFDLSTGKFKNSDTNHGGKKSETTRAIMNLINKKKGTNKSRQKSGGRSNRDTQPVVVNPLDNL
jgi:hypothetical protein